jgi:hypothetical protein
MIDLGLAVTGAVLLLKGLARPEVAAPITPAKPAQKTEAPPVPEPRNVTGSAAVPSKTSATEPKVAAAARKEERRPKDKAKRSPAPPATKAAPSPTTEPPSAEHDMTPEVDQHSARSRAAFDRCAAAAGAVHGQIQIVFEIQPDGSITHIGKGENTTGNDELARCLADEIGSWKLSAHQGPTTQFVKSFLYP